MPVTLVSDPIVSEQLVQDMLKLSGDQARAYINSVSGLFMRFTQRSRISEGEAVDKDKAPPPSIPVIWLRATPIASVTSVKLYSLGVESRTLATSDYVLNTDTGRMVFGSTIPGFGSPEQVIVTSYEGGWTEIPGDVVQTALEMIKLQHARLTGRVGVLSESREGYSATYDRGDIPESIKGVWQRYRVY